MALNFVAISYSRDSSSVSAPMKFSNSDVGASMAWFSTQLVSSSIGAATCSLKNVSILKQPKDMWRAPTGIAICSRSSYVSGLLSSSGVFALCSSKLFVFMLFFNVAIHRASNRGWGRRGPFITGIGRGGRIGLEGERSLESLADRVQVLLDHCLAGEGLGRSVDCLFWTSLHRVFNRAKGWCDCCVDRDLLWFANLFACALFDGFSIDLARRGSRNCVQEYDTTIQLLVSGQILTHVSSDIHLVEFAIKDFDDVSSGWFAYGADGRGDTNDSGVHNIRVVSQGRFKFGWRDLPSSDFDHLLLGISQRTWEKRKWGLIYLPSYGRWCRICHTLRSQGRLSWAILRRLSQHYLLRSSQGILALSWALWH